MAEQTEETPIHATQPRLLTRKSTMGSEKHFITLIVVKTENPTHCVAI